MNYLSICSGIEAATVAWHPLGWHPLAFAEIDAFPSAVLAHHWPAVPNLGDVTEFKRWPGYAVDALVGGTPCQSFSIAGLRAGLDDPRGRLMLTYLAIAKRYRPRWILWENVTGVLSKNQGRDFGTFLGGLAQLGYGWAYRVLDAQHVRTRSHPWAVPQRRRRVFVVGYLGDWRRAAAVLFDGASLRGDSPPRRTAGQTITGAISGGAHPGGANGQDAYNGLLIPEIVPQAMSAKWAKGSSGPAGDEVANLVVAHALRADGFDASEDGTGRGTPLIAFGSKDGGADAASDVSPTLRAGADAGGNPNGGMAPAIAIPFDTTQITHPANRSNPQPGDPAGTLAKDGHPPAMAFQTRLARNGRGAPDEVAYPLTAEAGRTGKGDSANVVAVDLRNQVVGGDVAATMPASGYKAGPNTVPHVLQWSVRRLTPLECERLQGFPDGYTAISYRGRPAADGPRYKALGNSMPVNVMTLLGERIEMVDAL